MASRRHASAAHGGGVPISSTPPAARVTAAAASAAEASPIDGIDGPAYGRGMFALGAAISVYACARCVVPFGDSTAQMETDADMDDRLVLEIGSNLTCDFARESWLTPRPPASGHHHVAAALDGVADGLEYRLGVQYSLLQCSSCSAAVGRVWRTQPGPRRAYAGKVMLDRSAVRESYVVGGGRSFASVDGAENAEGEGAHQSALTAVMTMLLVHRDELEEHREEIAELRAQLAAVSGGQPLLPRTQSMQSTQHLQQAAPVPSPTRAPKRKLTPTLVTDEGRTVPAAAATAAVAAASKPARAPTKSGAGITSSSILHTTISQVSLAPGPIYSTSPIILPPNAILPPRFPPSPAKPAAASSKTPVGSPTKSKQPSSSPAKRAHIFERDEEDEADDLDDEELMRDDDDEEDDPFAFDSASSATPLLPQAKKQKLAASTTKGKR